MTLNREIFARDERDPSSPLDFEDREGLRLTDLQTVGELNAAEVRNILASQMKPRWKKMATSKLLDDLIIRSLHEAMFGEVWDWAGKYRTKEMTIGLAPERISTELKQLVENAKYWLQVDQPQEILEATCRLHHRLVEIHPFYNGNGRIAREYIDLILHSLGQEPFTWGRGSADPEPVVRSKYIDAIHEADRGNFQLLYDFVRS